MKIAKAQPTGMLGFSIIGQLVSLTGSGMTVFALTLWAWQAGHRLGHSVLLKRC